jgi:thioredoxin-like negative regulator of GroEL
LYFCIPFLVAIARFVLLVRAEPNIKKLQRRIFEAFRNEEYAEVEKFLKQSVQIDPDNPDILLFTFRLMIQYREYEKALHSVNIIGIQFEEFADYLGDGVTNLKKWSMA